jgi:hypothetical protein
MKPESSPDPTPPATPAAAPMPHAKPAAVDAHHPSFQAPLNPKASFHAFDSSDRFGRIQPRKNFDASLAARAAREHARGRHSG